MGQKVIFRFWGESGWSSASRNHLTTFCRPFAHYTWIVFRDSSLYPRQLSLFCLLWLISANFAKTLVWKTWIWRQIMMSQTTHTKYKWHHTPLNENPMKIFCVRHWCLQRTLLIQEKPFAKFAKCNHSETMWA